MSPMCASRSHPSPRSAVATSLTALRLMSPSPSTSNHATSLTSRLVQPDDLPGVDPPDGGGDLPVEGDLPHQQHVRLVRLLPGDGIPVGLVRGDLAVDVLALPGLDDEPRPLRPDDLPPVVQLHDPHLDHRPPPYCGETAPAEMLRVAAGPGM